MNSFLQVSPQKLQAFLSDGAPAVASRQMLRGGAVGVVCSDCEAAGQVFPSGCIPGDRAYTNVLHV